MKPKITYLFGAGASYGALPVVKEFNQPFTRFVQKMTNQFDVSHTTLISKLKTFQDEMQNHSTVDTFARVLDLSGRHDDYRSLKFFVSLFFLFEQLKNPVNKRYDLFYASIFRGTHGSIKLPNNLRILSWNYDSQFEIALAKFYRQSTSLAAYSNIPIFPALSRKFFPPSLANGFSIFKINGSAELRLSVHNEISRWMDIDAAQLSDHECLRKIREILQYYDSGGQNSLLSFSWEDDAVMNVYRNHALKSIEGSDILVVIGYSFPTFNRGMDKLILTQLINNPDFKKIYIQAPENDVQSIITRVKALMSKESGIEIIPITDLDEFYIPFEFDGDYSYSSNS